MGSAKVNSTAHLAEGNAGDVSLLLVCAPEYLAGSADVRPALLLNHLGRRRKHHTHSCGCAKLAANTPHLHSTPPSSRMGMRRPSYAVTTTTAQVQQGAQHRVHISARFYPPYHVVTCSAITHAPSRMPLELVLQPMCRVPAYSMRSSFSRFLVCVCRVQLCSPVSPHLPFQLPAASRLCCMPHWSLQREQHWGWWA